MDASSAAEDVDARIVTNPAVRAEAWTQLIAVYPELGTYQALTDRVLPIPVLTRRPLQVGLAAVGKHFLRGA